LKELGSERTDPTMAPPRERAGLSFVVVVDAASSRLREPQATANAAEHATRARAMERRSIRSCLVKSWPTGQKIGRSKLCAARP
jgi:hypothetical protein